MKKSILIITMMLCSTTFVAAQETVMFGAKGGLNFSSFSGGGHEAFEDPEGLTSFHLGLVAEIPVSYRFSIQPEVLYSGQGYSIAKVDDGDNIGYQLNYVIVPIMAKFYLIDGLSIEAGPQIGFLVDQEIDYDPTSDDGDISLNEDQFSSTDLSLGLGAAYKINSFFVYGRYNMGLSGIYDDSFTDSVLSEADAKHSVLQAGIGFMF